MVQALRTSLRYGGLRQGGLQPGLGNDDIFATASLDLNFAVNKNLGTLVDATTGTNLVDFTRLSSGTYVDSQGVIRTATTNLLLRSEGLDNAVWTSTMSAGVTVTLDNTQGTPYSGTNAYRINFTAENQNGAQQVYTFTANIVYFASIWVKGTAGETIRFAGKAGQSADTFTLTGNWQRLLVGPFTATGGSAGFNLNTFGLTTARTVYATAAQLEQSSTVGEYIPTTSNINSAPRFDHNPTTGESLGLLVEESRINRFQWSNSAVNGETWNNVGSLFNLQTGATDPAGGTNGIIASDATSTNIGSFLQRTSIDATLPANTVVTYSVWIKPISTPNAVIILNLFANGTVDSITANFSNTGGVLSLGSTSVGGTGVVTSASAIPHPNGWYRLVLTGIPSTTVGSDMRARINLASYQQVQGTPRFYWYGAQLETGLASSPAAPFVTSYIPTSGSTVTRAADVASISGNNFGTTNLLTYSEEFDQSPWNVATTGGTVTITPNAALAPDGQNTADRFESSGGSNGIQQVLTLGLLPYTYSLYVKQADAGSSALIRLSVGPFYFSFDLVSGTFFDVDASFSPPVATQVGNGWWRISGTRTTTSTANAIRVFGVIGGFPSDVYIWGAQLEQSDVATPYVKSNVTWNSRASNATYYDSTGTIRKSSYNELLRSEEFDQSPWSKGSNTTVTPNQGLAPDGANTADRVVMPAGVGTFVQQSVAVTSGATYTFSLYAKAAATSSTVVLNLGTDTSGEIVLGTNWQRISVSTVAASSTATVAIDNGDKAIDILIWGAQLEKGTYAGDYAKTEATAASTERNAAYLPDDNGNFVSAGPLLLEEQRTNVITNNTMVGAVAGTPGTLPTNWGSFISPAGVTRSIVGTGTQNGVKYVDVKFAGTPSTTSEITLYLNGGIAASQGQAWAFTSWLAIAGGSTSNIASIRLRSFEQNSGAYVRETNTDVAPSVSADLFRFLHLTSSFGSGANEIRPVITVYASAAGIPIDVTLRIGLPQLEQGAFATSVIPTYGIAATRSADVSTSTSGFGNSWYNESEGTIYAEATPREFTNTDGIVSIDNDSGAERIQIRTAGNTGALNFIVVDNNSVQSNTSTSNYSVLNRTNRYSAAYKLNSFASCLNAGSTTSGTGTVPTPTQLQIGIAEALSESYFNGPIGRVCYWSQRLPNSTLSTITQ